MPIRSLFLRKLMDVFENRKRWRAQWFTEQSKYVFKLPLRYLAEQECVAHRKLKLVNVWLYLLSTLKSCKRCGYSCRRSVMNHTVMAQLAVGADTLALYFMLDPRNDQQWVSRWKIQRSMLLCWLWRYKNLFIYLFIEIHCRRQE